MSNPTTESTNGHSHSGGGSGDGSGGRSGDSITKSFSRRSDYKPTDLVQIRITAGLRDEFDEWYASQYPDVKQPPSRDPVIEDAFRRGLAELKRLAPPVPTLAERLAQASQDAS